MRTLVKHKSENWALVDGILSGALIVGMIAIPYYRNKLEDLKSDSKLREREEWSAGFESGWDSAVDETTRVLPESDRNEYLPQKFPVKK